MPLQLNSIVLCLLNQEENLTVTNKDLLRAFQLYQALNLSL